MCLLHRLFSFGKTTHAEGVPHQEDDQKVSEVSTTSKTSENLRKPRKPHNLETYVGFPENLLKWTSTETSGNLRKPLKIYGNLWKSTESYGNFKLLKWESKINNESYARLLY
jgi:hypothetical protein